MNKSRALQDTMLDEFPVSFSITLPFRLFQFRQRLDADPLAITRQRLKDHNTIRHREDGVILCQHYILARLEMHAALLDDDVTRADRLAAIHLNAQPLRAAVTTVLG